MSLICSVRSSVCRASHYVHRVVFGRNLLLTNSIISAAIGAAGDSIQQNYDLVTDELKQGKDGKSSKESSTFSYRRTCHMAAAGLTTGVVSHYWYLMLDRWLPGRAARVVLKKVLYDQIIFSPVNLLVYFSTLGIVEGSSVKRVQEELMEKGMQNIYVVEWMIWPPAQWFNFYVLPLRYRILFDNVISLGFDIYCPYVKYKTELKSEKEAKIQGGSISKSIPLTNGGSSQC